MPLPCQCPAQALFPSQGLGQLSNIIHMFDMCLMLGKVTLANCTVSTHSCGVALRHSSNFPAQVDNQIINL